MLSGKHHNIGKIGSKNGKEICTYFFIRITFWAEKALTVFKKYYCRIFLLRTLEQGRVVNTYH